MIKRIPDNFHSGVWIAAVISALVYFTVEWAEPYMQQLSFYKYLAFPRIYFMVFALQILILRLAMVNWKKHRFAQGWIFSVFIFALFIFFLIKKR
jgi:hypothetical protein